MFSNIQKWSFILLIILNILFGIFLICLSIYLNLTRDDYDCPATAIWMPLLYISSGVFLWRGHQIGFVIIMIYLLVGSIYHPAAAYTYIQEDVFRALLNIVISIIVYWFLYLIIFMPKPFRDEFLKRREIRKNEHTKARLKMFEGMGEKPD